MVESSIPSLQKQSSSVQFIPKLRSKLAVTLILSYALPITQVEKASKLLSKKAWQFYITNHQQINYFCLADPIPNIAINMGEFAFQFIRPNRQAFVERLEFPFITSDLYKLEDFAEGSLGFGKVLFGNRGFKLFDNATVQDIQGLQLSESYSEHDRANLRTLVSILKKTKTLILNRLSQVYMVLHILLLNIKQFPNLTGLEIEFSETHSELVSMVANMAPQLTSLMIIEPYWNTDHDTFNHVCKNLIDRCSNLKSCQISAEKTENNMLDLFTNNPANFVNLEDLIINSDMVSGSQIMQQLTEDRNQQALEAQENNQEMEVDQETIHPQTQVNMTLSDQIHDYFCQPHNQQFVNSLTKLKKLQVDRGIFPLRTASLFKQIFELQLRDGTDPADNDCLSEDLIQNLRKAIIDRIPENKVPLICEQLTNARNLKYLDLDYHKYSDAQPLINLVTNTKSLKELHIKEIKSDNLQFLSCLIENKTLESITVHMHKINKIDSNEKQLQDYLSKMFNGRKNRTLKKLVIKMSTYSNFKKSGNFSGPYLATILSMFTELDDFQLYNSTFIHNESDVFFKHLFKETKIKKLTLFNCQMDERPLYQFFAAIANKDEILEGKKNSLQELTMDKCNIDENSVPFIIDMLDNNSSLISINIRQASVEFESAFKPLMRAVKRHPTLRQLTLKQTKVLATQMEMITEMKKLLLDTISAKHFHTLIIEDLIQYHKLMSPMAAQQKNKIVADLKKALPNINQLKI